MRNKSSRIRLHIVPRNINPQQQAVEAARRYLATTGPIMLIAPIKTRRKPWVLDIWLDVRQMKPKPRMLVIANLSNIAGRSTIGKVNELDLLSRELRIPIHIYARRTPSVSALE
jgi:hypothetical protein